MSVFYRAIAVASVAVILSAQAASAAQSLVIHEERRKSLLVLKAPGDFACLSTKPKNRFGTIFLRSGNLRFQTKLIRPTLAAQTAKLTLLKKDLKLATKRGQTRKILSISKNLASQIKRVKNLRAFTTACRVFDPKDCQEFDANGACVFNTNDGISALGAKLSFPAGDLAVADNGQSFVVGVKEDRRNSIEVWGACFNGSLSAKKKEFLLVKTTPRNAPLVSPNLFIARHSEVVLSKDGMHAAVVARMYGTEAGRVVQQDWIGFFDQSCNLVHSSMEGGDNEGMISNDFYDLDMANDGTVAFARHSMSNNGVPYGGLQIYRPNGTRRYVLDTTGCAPSLRGMHVALNKTTGDGVLTCQGEYHDPVLFRRFSANGHWIDSGFRTVEESTNDYSSVYDSHAVGMLDDGSFGIIWQVSQGNQSANNGMYLNMYSQSGTLSASRRLTDSGSSDSYRDYHPMLFQPVGNSVSEYILPIGEASRVLGLMRVNKNGIASAYGTIADIANPEVLTTLPGSNDVLKSLRTTSNGDYYFLQNNYLRKNVSLGSAFVPVLGQ